MGEASGVQQPAPGAAVRRTGAVELPCSPDSAAQARRHVLQVCAESAREPLCQAVQLVTTELVANAVRHARSGVRLSVQPTSTGMLVEVADDSPRLPERRDP